MRGSIVRNFQSFQMYKQMETGHQIPGHAVGRAI